MRKFALRKCRTLGVCLLGSGRQSLWATTAQASTTLFVSPNFSPTSRVPTNIKIATYGYARQYSGVNLATFVKHITSSELTPAGLKGLGNAVMTLAATEGLDAHRIAVKMRLDYMEAENVASSR